MTKRRKPILPKRRKTPARQRLSRPSIKRQELRQGQIQVTEEAEYIISKAEIYDARMVTLGALVFFSTETGDAWVLDPEDGLALCLARDGDRQPFTITETATNFSIEWAADYRIEGNMFIVAERSGRIRAIQGYPVSEIRRALRSAR